jgi:RNA polymerase sigma-70 factor (ECF subfamily)
MNPKIEQNFLKSYDEFGDAIFRYCLIQTSDRELARDLTQDTFTRVWEYLARPQTDAEENIPKQIQNMKAFLYRVATNLIIDYRRKKKPTLSLETMMEEGFDVTGSRDQKEILETSFDSEKVVEALNKLDDKYRETLTLRYIEDLSLKEISQITGEGENNISVRIHRGLEKLKELLTFDN